MVFVVLQHVGIDHVRPGSLFEIEYQNESGKVTRRKIRIASSYDAHNGNTYVRAWCFLRGEERTFRADRILQWTELRQNPVQPQLVAAAPAPYVQPSAAVARPEAKSRMGSRIGSGLAAALVMGIGRLLMGSFNTPAASFPAPPYTIPKSAFAATATTQATARKAAARTITPQRTMSSRASAFERATGIQSAPLERLYAAADSNGNELLSWRELAAFQKAAESRFRYASNGVVLRPDQFIARGGGDCDDWAAFTCGLLRYWGWDPYVGCFESPSGDEGHAVCLVRVMDVPTGFLCYTVTEASARGLMIPEGRYVPVDYEVVGGISNAMGARWSLEELYVPERIYGSAM